MRGRSYLTVLCALPALLCGACWARTTAPVAGGARQFVAAAFAGAPSPRIEGTNALPDVPSGGVQDFPRLASLYAYVTVAQAPTFRRYGLVVAPQAAGPDGAVLALKRLSPATRVVAYLDSSAVRIAGFDDMRIYPGWWLTLAGTRLTAPLSASSRVVRVADARIIARRLARFPDVLVDDESMHVLSVDEAHDALVVQRGYRSAAAPHAAGARLAAHAGNWPGSWMLNITPYCPVDPSTGLTWAGALVERARRVLATGPWDGIYYDNANASWAPLAGGQLDANGDNIPDGGNGPSGAGWRQGEDSLFARTRALLHPALLLANGGSYPAASNGREFEHFPSLEYGWSRAFRTYLDLSGPGAPAPYSIVNADTGNTGLQRLRDMRFYLAAALMGNGYYAYDAGTENHGQTWWYDEYDDGAGSSLARPLDATQTAMRLAAGTGRRFRAGDVVEVPGGVADHDDERMLIKAVRGDTLVVERGYRGSRRAAHPAHSKVATAAQLAAGQGWLGRPLGPATIVRGNGAAALWRRDFTHGTVLLNATDKPQVVALGRGYRRIAGTQDRAVNSGAPAPILTLAPRDAILLVKT